MDANRRSSDFRYVRSRSHLGNKNCSMPHTVVHRKAEGVRPDPRLVLVAGPSGAGKSTFIELLKAQKLPSNLQRVFPPRIYTWRTVEANILLKRGDGGIAHESLVDVILHYDTAMIRRFGVSSYADDPVFSLIPADLSIIVISVGPPAEMLYAQIDARRRTQMQHKGRLRTMWRHSVMPFRRLSRRLRGRDCAEASRIYSDADCLDQLYRDWDDFSLRLVGGNASSRRFRVEPRAWDRSFVLVKAIEPCVGHSC